jgi:hypothetical protein
MFRLAPIIPWHASPAVHTGPLRGCRPSSTDRNIGFAETRSKHEPLASNTSLVHRIARRFPSATLVFKDFVASWGQHAPYFTQRASQSDPRIHNQAAPSARHSNRQLSTANTKTPRNKPKTWGAAEKAEHRRIAMPWWSAAIACAASIHVLEEV